MFRDYPLKIIATSPGGQVVELLIWPHDSVFFDQDGGVIQGHGAKHFNSLRPSDAYASGNSAIIGSDNSLLPVRHQANIEANARLMQIGTLGTNFSETLVDIKTFSFKKIYLKMSSGKWWPFCLGLNVLM